MKRRIWTIAAGLASVAALAAVPSALAAFTTSKLEVRSTASATTFKLTQASSDDAVASVRIFVPAGTTLTTTQAPGTTLGAVTALLKLHALAGAEVPVTGNVVVAPPGAVPAAAVAACTGGATPQATWLLALSIAGNPVSVPLYVVPTSGALAALGPAYIQTCIASPYIPSDQGGATAGAQLVNAEFGVQGVFSQVTLGAFVAILTPWTPGTATVNAAGTVAAPAAIAPGAVSATARRAGAGAIVAGRVTQAGQARGGATVAVFGGPRANRLKRLGRVQVRANGMYTFRAKTGTFFRANAVAAPGSAAPLCTQLAPLQALGISCVNPTVNGFVAQSRVVRKR
jgi:hypothetical protein